MYSFHENKNSYKNHVLHVSRISDIYIIKYYGVTQIRKNISISCKYIHIHIIALRDRISVSYENIFLVWQQIYDDISIYFTITILFLLCLHTNI